jgi:hypothetical protein
MHQAQFPPQRPLRPWYGVGEIAERLPQVVSAFTARIPPLDPSEDPTGAVGQPYRVPLDPRVGMPQLSETTLIAAHHRCSCAREPERMAWEEWSPGQWAWYRRRQRVMAQRAAQREMRAEKAVSA